MTKDLGWGLPAPFVVSSYFISPFVVSLSNHGRGGDGSYLVWQRRGLRRIIAYTKE